MSPVVKRKGRGTRKGKWKRRLSSTEEKVSSSSARNSQKKRRSAALYAQRTKEALLDWGGKDQEKKRASLDES